MWELFRLGPPGSYSSDPSERSTFPGSRFPTRRFDALIERDGPLTLLSHSASGPIALAAGARSPARIAAQVLVEPSGAPDPSTIDLGSLRRALHLFIWGDYVDLDPTGGWQELRRSSLAYATALRSAGGRVTWVDLPRMGIKGNSRMLMFDDNGHEIAERIIRWLGHDTRQLTPRRRPW